jgi:hypothetical protein
LNKVGFTLVEILLALFLLVITAGIFTFSIKQCRIIYNHVNYRLSCERSAANQMEKLKAVAFDNLLPLNGSSFGPETIMLITPLASDLLKIEVNAGPVKLDTLRSKY